jgi:hypothetical protein
MNQTQSTPTIRIFPDFGGFTHTIDYPNDHWYTPNKYPTHEELVPGELNAMLYHWECEFERCAFDDSYQNKPGTMLWISFDLQGIKIAKQIKRHVGAKARVIYQKPVECPYFRYDTSREVMESGELVTLNYRVGWHNLMVSGAASGSIAD